VIGPPEMNDPDGALCRGELVTFVVHGPPQPWQRATPLGNGKSVRPKATRLYQRAVRDVAALHLGRWRKDGLYRLHVHAVFNDARRRDADNVGKSCGDALNGIAYEDDSQVVDARCTKAVEPGRARTVVTIERVGDAPQKRRKAGAR
jgi:Holliday junction resolvase RusA-like endonuclease